MCIGKDNVMDFKIVWMSLNLEKECTMEVFENGVQRRGRK